jgi:hypothetical protein
MSGRLVGLALYQLERARRALALFSAREHRVVQRQLSGTSNDRDHSTMHGEAIEAPLACERCCQQFACRRAAKNRDAQHSEGGPISVRAIGNQKVLPRPGLLSTPLSTSLSPPRKSSRRV